MKDSESLEDFYKRKNISHSQSPIPKNPSQSKNVTLDPA